MSHIPDTIILNKFLTYASLPRGIPKGQDVFEISVITPKTSSVIVPSSADTPEGVLRCRLEVPNEMFSNIKITGALYSSSDNIFQVMDESGRVFKIQGKTILDCMRAGEARGDVLISDFVWALEGVKMWPIRVGSSFYNELMHEKIRKESAKRISNKDFVVGGVYETLGGTKAVYVGKAKHCGLLFCYFYGYLSSGNQHSFDKSPHRSHRFLKSHSFVKDTRDSVNISDSKYDEISQNATEALEDLIKKKENDVIFEKIEKERLLRLMASIFNSSSTDEENICSLRRSRYIFKDREYGVSYENTAKAMRLIVEEFKSKGVLEVLENEQLLKL